RISLVTQPGLEYAGMAYMTRKEVVPAPHFTASGESRLALSVCPSQSLHARSDGRFAEREVFAIPRVPAEAVYRGELHASELPPQFPRALTALRDRIRCPGAWAVCLSPRIRTPRVTLRQQ